MAMQRKLWSINALGADSDETGGHYHATCVTCRQRNRSESAAASKNAG